MKLSTKFSTSMKRSYKILGMVEVSKNIDVYVDAYANCREQGFSVTRWAGHTSVKLSFGEHRRSDSIVVYVGNMYEFDTHGIPNEEIYGNARMFKDEKAAAKFIQDVLNNGVKK